MVTILGSAVLKQKEGKISGKSQDEQYHRYDATWCQQSRHLVRAQVVVSTSELKFLQEQLLYPHHDQY